MGDSSPEDVVDPYHQFAIDVINTVQQIDNLVPITMNRSGLLTKKHKKDIKKYQVSQMNNWTREIDQVAAGKYDYHAFQACLEHLTNIYKPEEYSEKGFVNFCSVIAFLGVYFTYNWKGCAGRIWAINRIDSLTSGILSRGTLEESSW